MLQRSTLLCFILNISVQRSFAQYKDSYMFAGRSGIVQLFEWTFNDIAAECEFLGDNGYGGVQVPPVHESKIDDTYSWYLRYQPISYNIASRSGTAEELQNMIKKCLESKIRIYVDVVFNHMASASGDGEIMGDAHSTAVPHKLQYPDVPYTSEDFHEFCLSANYSNAFEIRNCRVAGLPDLDQGKENVKEKVAKFLNELIDYGVAGFRVDAVKHMWPMDLASIYEKLNNLSTKFEFPENSRPFIYQEVIDLGGEAVSKTEYVGMGVVTEFMHSRDLGLTFRGKKPLHELLQWGPAKGFLPSNDALVFVDNHDNQRGQAVGRDQIISYKDKKQYIMASAFMLAHTYGLPRIMSSYEFEFENQGPPADANHHIVGRNVNAEGQCESPWVCEHRWKAVTAMVKFRNVVQNSTIGNWADNGQNQMAFCRGNLGFIAINNELSLNFKSTLQTCVPPGIYCDVISGDKVGGRCSGEQIVVDADGKAEIVIPYDREIPIVAFHIGSKL